MRDRIESGYKPNRFIIESESPNEECGYCGNLMFKHESICGKVAWECTKIGCDREKKK
jgi:hypothetical protein